MREHDRKLRQFGDALFTSNLVLAETATRLRYDAGLRAAVTFGELVDEAVARGLLTVRYTDPELDARAWEVMGRYPELSLSFTDCVGAVTAREARVACVFGLEADFRALGFPLEP